MSPAIPIADLRCDRCGSQEIVGIAPGSEPDRVLGPDTLPLNCGEALRCMCMACWAMVEEVA
jgi:hypothetical protein